GSPTRIRTGVFRPIFPQRGDKGFRAEYRPSRLHHVSGHNDGGGDDWRPSRPRRLGIPWATSTSGGRSLHWSSYQSSTWTGISPFSSCRIMVVTPSRTLVARLHHVEFGPPGVFPSSARSGPRGN